MPLETKYPIVIPSKHYVTKMIIQEIHDTVKHNGIRETLNRVRGRY